MGISIIRPTSFQHANLKITKGTKEISIAFDDSCGALPHLSRGDIALFQNDDNMTSQVYEPNEWGHTVYASLEALKKAIEWIES